MICSRLGGSSIMAMAKLSVLGCGNSCHWWKFCVFFLVSGCLPTPLKKYAQVKLDHLPNLRGEQKIYMRNHHLFFFRNLKKAWRKKLVNISEGYTQLHVTTMSVPSDFWEILGTLSRSSFRKVGNCIIFTHSLAPLRFAKGGSEK